MASRCIDNGYPVLRTTSLTMLGNSLTKRIPSEVSTVNSLILLPAEIAEITKICNVKFKIPLEKYHLVMCFTLTLKYDKSYIFDKVSLPKEMII